MFTVFQASPERRIAVACVMLGLIVAALLAPKDAFFLPNVAFFWGSQVGVLVFVSPFKPRAAVVAGIAFALALYLSAFGLWVSTRMHPESMAWLGYIFSLPGALVGAIAVAISLRQRSTLAAQSAGSLAAGIVLVGTILNQAAVCSAVISCGAK